MVQGFSFRYQDEVLRLRQNNHAEEVGLEPLYAEVRRKGHSVDTKTPVVISALMAGPEGIEPPYQVLETCVLPLN